MNDPTRFVRPSPPFLEVAVYRPDLADEESLAETLSVFRRFGGSPTGVVGVWRVATGRFARITDYPIEPVRIAPSALRALLDNHPTNDSAMQVMQIYTQGYFDDAKSLVTYLSVSEKASLTDRHPVAIWATGSDFDFDPEKRERLGDHARELLLELARSSEVAYGAITMDYGLESPADLLEGGPSEAFTDFVVTARIATAARERIRDQFEGAYIEEFEGGTYISTTPAFNPRRISLVDALARSRTVGEVVAAGLLDGEQVGR